MVTIDEASTYLENFIGEKDNLNVLEDCIGSLQQIRGSLDLVQLYGACELAGEILTAANDIKTGNTVNIDDKLAALTKGFFVLSCYFEYIQQHEVGMPVLLIPYINDIRLANRQTALPESFFENAQLSYRCPPSEKATLTQEQIDSLRRYRHMYQAGLLGVIKEINIEQSLKMMLRAVGKIYHFSKGSPSETLWWLAYYALQAFIDAQMLVNVSRKCLFSMLDKALRHLEKEGQAAFETAIDDNLLKQLAYFISIADIDQPEYKKITQLYGFDAICYTDKVLQQETVNLTGPTASTVQSVAEVLRVELNFCKEQIEQAQTMDDSNLDESYADTLSRVQKIKEILNIVGLIYASDILHEPIEKLDQARGKGLTLEDSEITLIAAAFLYIENVLSSHEKRNFSGDKLAEINKLTQQEIISSSHLQDAQLVVISQIEEGLQTIKSSLTDFTSGGYDSSNIDALPALFNEIRGGMVVLNLPRAGIILDKCVQFIEKTLLSDNEVAALEQLMETFADALICLEYYIDCIKVDKNVSSDTLKVAEDSFAALGFNVNS